MHGHVACSVRHAVVQSGPCMHDVAAGASVVESMRAQHRMCAASAHREKGRRCMHQDRAAGLVDSRMGWMGWHADLCKHACVL